MKYFLYLSNLIIFHPILLAIALSSISFFLINKIVFEKDEKNIECQVVHFIGRLTCNMNRERSAKYEV